MNLKDEYIKGQTLYMTGFFSIRAVTVIRVGKTFVETKDETGTKYKWKVKDLKEIKKTRADALETVLAHRRDAVKAATAELKVTIDHRNEFTKELAKELSFDPIMFAGVIVGSIQANQMMGSRDLAATIRVDRVLVPELLNALNYNLKRYNLEAENNGLFLRVFYTGPDTLASLPVDPTIPPPQAKIVSMKDYGEKAPPTLEKSSES